MKCQNSYYLVHKEYSTNIVAVESLSIMSRAGEGSPLPHTKCVGKPSGDGQGVVNCFSKVVIGHTWCQGKAGF